MKFSGRFVSVNTDWQTNQTQITFTVNEKSELQYLDAIKDCEKLDIEAKKHREKRSLNANAYCWHLLQEIAEAVHSDKWSVYLECLRKYSRAFTHIIVKPNAVEAVKELCRTCIDLGEISVNGMKGHQLQIYYGSSTFDTKEMSVFLDGIVSECKELGIETMTPADLEVMKSAWQKES